MTGLKETEIFLLQETFKFSCLWEALDQRCSHLHVDKPLLLGIGFPGFLFVVGVELDLSFGFVEGVELVLAIAWLPCLVSVLEHGVMQRFH